MNQAQKHALALLHAREDERRRIAKALHKGVAQSLASLRIQLEVCESQLPDSAPHARYGLAHLRPLVEHSFAELQELLSSLRSAIPDDIGFPAALRALVSFVCTRTGQDIHLHIDEPFPALLWPIESMLYQTIKEILSLEPSGVLTPLAVRLERHTAAIQLKIQSRARGARDSLLSESVVLARIREQAEALGGTGVVSSYEDEAPLEAIVITLPLLLRDTEETT